MKSSDNIKSRIWSNQIKKIWEGEESLNHFPIPMTIQQGIPQYSGTNLKDKKNKHNMTKDKNQRKTFSQALVVNGNNRQPTTVKY